MEATNYIKINEDVRDIFLSLRITCNKYLKLECILLCRQINYIDVVFLERYLPFQMFHML